MVTFVPLFSVAMRHTSNASTRSRTF